MLIQQGYKYRLEPTAEQAARLAVLCGHARFVWNHGLRHSRAIEGKIKNCTISQRAGHWYISFLAERRIEKPQHPSSTAAGIDMGVAQFVTLSDGSHKEPLNAYRKHQKKLAIEQRKLARKVKFSQNWVKQNRVLQRLNCCIAHCRTDFLHKTSTEISKNHAMIAIEDLRVSNMSKSVKGTADNLGTHVSAKSGLNKSILDQGWYSFRRMLEYKQQWRGGIVVTVPAQYTSQTCPECGHISKDNRTTQARFCCIACNYSNNADVVAAINILERGHRLLACGESALAAQ